MVVIIELKKEDVKSIASLHQKGFENFFLTSLGSEFLQKFYYSIIKCENGIAIGAFDNNGDLVGFAVGAKKKKGFYKELLKTNFFPLLISSVQSLIANPVKIYRLAKSFLTRETTNENYLNSATLLSICVNPSKKGLNIGKSLLQSFEVEVEKFSDSITLTTDAINNDYVNNFYVSNNYVLADSFRQGNRKMNFYIKKLK